MKNFKPMLAGTVEDVNKLTYPMWASPKLDGIRAVVIDGVLLSRNLKPIPNKHVQSKFGLSDLNGLDGELILSTRNTADLFRLTSSAVMSVDGEPDVIFVVFDHFLCGEPRYAMRYQFMQPVQRNKYKGVRLIETVAVHNPQEVTALEELWLAQGYEGLMLRNAESPYKYGRSTLRESYLLKLKRFADSEAIILGFEEQQHNGNEATTDNLGHTKRTSHKANKTGKGTLGAFKVRDIKTGVEFNIGTGMDDALRAEIWNNWPTYSKQIVKYKYFPTGSKDKPRFPVFIGFRHPIDV
jgi:DNA ligase-1